MFEVANVVEGDGVFENAEVDVSDVFDCDDVESTEFGVRDSIVAILRLM